MTERLTKKTGAPPGDEAAQWMARKMSGAMNAEERRAFEKWLADSTDNTQAFANMEARVDGADAHGDDLLAAEFERQLTEEAYREAGGRRTFYRIAAALAAVAVVAVIATFTQMNGIRTPLAYETSVGETEKISLEDGSEIELNTASRVKVAFGPSSRKVELAAGEAFFNVEKDRDRPFVVKTDAAEISVTGTSFSVSSLEDRLSVHVLTGVVEVKPLADHSSTLLAGDSIEIGSDGIAGEVTRYDPSLLFAWRSGKARFHDAPLGEVVSSLNRYFETPIALDDEALAQLRVTGEFDIRDRETAIRALALIFDLESRDEAARTILGRPQSR